MAADPKVKAKAVADLLAGKNLDDIAKKYKVAASTVKRWAGELKQDKSDSHPGTQRKLNAFKDAVERFAVATLDMLTAQAELLADKDYIRNRTTDDVVQHTRFLSERLVEHIKLDRALQPAGPALPEPSGAITPEIVEDVA